MLFGFRLHQLERRAKAPISFVHHEKHRHSLYIAVGGFLLNSLFTESRGRLELVACELAPADGVDVWRLVVDPLVELILPAVEVDKQQSTHAAFHGGHTHQAWLHEVHCLQLQVSGETMTWVVLRNITNCMFMCCLIKFVPPNICA